jgi:hypothetical protein
VLQWIQWQQQLQVLRSQQRGAGEAAAHSACSRLHCQSCQQGSSYRPRCLHSRCPGVGTHSKNNSSSIKIISAVLGGVSAKLQPRNTVCIHDYHCHQLAAAKHLLPWEDNSCMAGVTNWHVISTISRPARVLPDCVVLSPGHDNVCEFATIQSSV